jgi:hypothetical protein
MRPGLGFVKLPAKRQTPAKLMQILPVGASLLPIEKPH